MGLDETKNLTKEDIIAIITKELPHLITENSEIRDKLIDVMSDVFPKKEDQAVLLSEIKILRQDFNTEMRALREEFQTEMVTLREEFQAEMGVLREEFQAEMGVLREEFQTEMRALREEFQTWREESDRRFEEHSREIKTLREEMQSGFRALDNKVVGLGARWGIMSEETFRDGLKGILTDELDLKVERYQGYDEEGYVFGEPDQIELDVVVRNGLLIVMEIRSSMSKGDVYTFQRKIEFYEKVHNVEVSRKIILSPFIDHRAVPAAHRLEMEMYSSASEASL